MTMHLTMVILCLVTMLYQVGGSCEERCGGGHRTLCRYFCEPAVYQHRTADQSDKKNEKPVTYRSREVKEGIEGLFEILNQLDRELSKKIPKPEAKIVNGRPAYEGQFPFVASLKIRNINRYMHFCGGSAISTSHILTAAHCVVAVRTQSLFVSIGDHTVSKKDTYERVIQADKIIIHEDFDGSNFENDIAIIKLKTPFKPHNARQTIHRMADKDMLQNMINENHRPNLTVLGWGSVYEGGPAAKILNFVEVPYIDHATCRAAMNPYEVFDGMLCAGDIEAGKIDACQGDSGGPIVTRKDSSRDDAQSRTFLFDLGVKDANNFLKPSKYEDYNFDYSFEDPNQTIIDHGWELAGLVSWGIGCAQPGYAGIYTNVAYYKEWIAENLDK